MKAPSAVARAYARALHALARERNAADAVTAELERLVTLVSGDRALADFFARPWIAAATKRTVAAEVAERAGLSRLMRDFLALVAGRGRAAQLDDIVAAYRDLIDADLGRVRARVRTAVPLTDAERATLGAKLGARLGKQVVLEETVDPALLGGFVAEVGSYIVDGSLEGQLAQLGARLAEG
ncbi:MAG: ATP synthase F1 subunit delta [Candidatus Rokubacteria bacterium]|nr:ATP synthase F1 subunit delta [Candidatus Rokubacteria bacterium]MBI3826799.1 ATP synthase F1 subunit delta [Candidatus Rokubacteria bacterium]